MISLDVIIIGAGPIGIACGIEAGKRGLSYLIIEKGCIVNSLHNYPEGMSFFSGPENLEIDQVPFISQNAKPLKSEALEYYRRIVNVKDLHINLFEKVINVEQELDCFRIKTSKRIYTAQNVVIATGFYDTPNMLYVPGEHLPKVSHYYKSAHYYARQKVAIVGAGNSAVDAALEIFRKGGEVSLIVRGKGIGERVKYWVKPDIENRIKDGSIKAYFNTEIEEIKEKELIIKTQNDSIILENDFLLALTGYMPDFDFLKKMGIKITNNNKPRPLYDHKTMETNIPGIYLAGVVCGGMETHKWYIENSRIHAPIIMNEIKNKKPKAECL